MRTLKIFDKPKLPQIDSNAVQQALDAFDGRSLPITNDEATDSLVKNFLTERQALRKLFIKSVTISKLSADLTKKIVLYIETFSSSELENETFSSSELENKMYVLMKSANRIADDARELAEKYASFLQSLIDISEQSSRQNNENQNVILQRNSIIALGVLTVLSVPLTAGFSLIMTQVVSSGLIAAEVAGASFFAFLGAKAEKKKNKREVLESLIKKIDISYGNVKQFENVWRHLADEAILQKENIKEEIDSIEESDTDNFIITEKKANDLKLKWEEMYDIFKSYATNVQEQLDSTDIFVH
ncbi:11882_t:CDS:1 [Ambispora gerdemannii]|uniref:11882_t:CDS:1 n=1 Tax=Ambispora gerdemannii TaxID=144530 RepID=A0A9N9D4Y4_9GLOM|nr:11882_t:CDS:1 [Ambispora gerdemannii]